ncbi:hypothetical protein K469DRAFT_696726 [Zopfia rhizophila CBS 207.26]|uniref:BTB domain-containing protein n=1 Tax=Zopfia rhizophila CBS 207.26 TaxID=1314779 RepID=A0A6A6EJP3_9PEZI|nr:hypothetical protein K469DRAFT_696726 [Zopfia rhizophila CBS 207.26]
MAPTFAGATQKRAKQSAPRIVPVIPLAFSRAPPSARPITPEETVTETAPVTHQVEEPCPVPEKGPEEQHGGPIQAPLTLDSKASAINNGELEAGTPASSLAEPRDEILDEELATPVSGSEEQERPATATSSLPHPDPMGGSLNNDNLATTLSMELPAAFDPSEPPTTLTPTAEVQAPILPPSKKIPIHHPRPSADNIIFGGVSESPIPPSTPHELESDTRGPHQPLPRPPPGFAHPKYAAPFYPSHSQHPSDPPAPWLYPAFAMPPPDGAYGYGREYHPTIWSGQDAFPHPHHSRFSSQAVSVALNGTNPKSRSPSQSPIKSQAADTKPSSEFDGEPPMMPYQNGSHVPVMGAKFEEWPFELAAYLSSQFGNPEFADFILQIRSENTTLLSMPVHGIVVARSQTIASVISGISTSTARMKGSRALIDIVTPDRLVTAESLTEAAKFLYGAPLLSVESFLFGLRPFHPDGEDAPSFAEARKRMSQALSYSATGVVLQLRTMSNRGVQIAQKLLRWDTLDQVVSFALDGGLPSSWNKSSHQGGSIPDHSYPATYDPYSTALLYDVADFVAYNFPADFSLYTIAPELAHSPRLPSLVEARPPTHNPRLSKIRFGDAPPEEASQPNYVTRVLSSILLSLPAPLLQHLFSHHGIANLLGWTKVVEIMRAVVDERENRRKKAVKGQIRTNPNGVEKSLTENLHWEERVEPSTEHASGHHLTRQRLADYV